MRVIFKRRNRGQIDFGIIYGGIVLAVLFIPWFYPVLSMSPSCAFRGLAGVPCPTCGSTRAIVHLSHGEITSALAMNPIVSLVIVLSVLYFFYSVITQAFDCPRIGFILTEREKNAARVAAMLLLLTHWGWLVLTL
jgi:uncharacterized protein DUF2752